MGVRDPAGGDGIVAVVAVTDDGKLVLVEQVRPSVGRAVIELPAGLAGDAAGAEHETLLDAARRELVEETGYAARDWTELAAGTTSAGLCDEIVTLFRATGLTKTGAGGGDGSEQITLHEVPLTAVEQWLRDRTRDGRTLVDLKVYSALAFAQARAVE